MTQMLKNITVYIYALMGEGKTMVAVSKAYNYLKEGYKIVSNIPLNFPHVYVDEPKEIESILVDLDEKYFDSKKFLLLDEVDKWLISRLYRREINIVLAQMYGYTRKWNCDVWSTGHRLKNLDVMIRGITNYFYLPVMYPIVDLKVRDYKVRYGVNWLDKYEEDYKFHANELEENAIVYDVYNANGLYVCSYFIDNLGDVKDLYDTRSRVKPLLGNGVNVGKPLP